MLYDSHCHLSPSVNLQKFNDETIHHLRNQSWPINIMMTNHIDKEILINAMNNPLIRNNVNIFLNIGIHPWFTHLYTFLQIESEESGIEFKRRHYKTVLEPYSSTKVNESQFETLLTNLPTPIPIVEQINEFRALICSTGVENRLNIGEIGLDKLFRIPICGYLCNPTIDLQKGKELGLSDYKVTMTHQVLILQEFFKLVSEFKKRDSPILMSLHCVNAHGLLFEELRTFSTQERFENDVNVSMHSYSGSVENARMLGTLKNINVWFGVSDFVNLKYEKGCKKWNIMHEILCKHKERVLAETDLGVDTLLNEHDSAVEVVLQKMERFDAQGLDRQQLWRNWCNFIGGEQMLISGL